MEDRVRLRRVASRGARRDGDERRRTDRRRAARWKPSAGSRARSRARRPRATRPRMRWTPRARRPSVCSPTRGSAGTDAGRRRRRCGPRGRRGRGGGDPCRTATPRRRSFAGACPPDARRAGRRAHRHLLASGGIARARSDDQGADPRPPGRGRARGRASFSGSASWRSPTRGAPSAVDELGGEEARAARRATLRLSPARVDALLAELAATPEPATPRRTAGRRPLDANALQRPSWIALARRSRRCDRRLDALRDERWSCPGYIEPLRRLLPLVPELAELDDEQLRLLRLGTVALVLNTDDERIVETLREALAEELGDRFALVWTRVEDGAIGCLIVFPPRRAAAVQALLGPRARFGTPRCPTRSSVSRCARPWTRWSAGSPSSRRRSPPYAAEREALLRPHVARLRDAARGHRRRARAARGGRAPRRDAARVRRRRAGCRDGSSRGCATSSTSRLGAAVARRGPGDLPPRPRGAGADAQLAPRPAVRAARRASSTCRAPARSTRRC